MSYNLKVFGAAWCPACTVLKANLSDANISFDYVDCDSEDGMAEAQNLGIRGLPTTLVTYNGETIRLIVGLQPIKEYRKYDGLQPPLTEELPTETAINE
jgi:thioredoxin-like negative regulator of GroEL